MIGSQYVIQVSIGRQKDDSHVVNVAGRQRMLSQEIAKAAMRLQQESDSEKIQQHRGELQQSLEVWHRSHLGLQNGDPESNLPGNNSPEIVELFEVIQPHFEAMVTSSNRILSITASSSFEAEDLDQGLNQIEAHEADFLRNMDAIVG